ncbi:MAG: SusD/RagB family nutrient-binding outer membrane lipoprotein [Bacteroidota bacterium]
MKTIALLLLACVCAGTACDTINESFTDGYNEDPNNPSEGTPNVIFRSGSVAMILFMTDQAARLSNLWTQHYTGSDRQYSSQNVYTITATDFDNMWTTAYVDAVVNFRAAKSGIEESETNIRAVVDLSEALTFSTLAALFGDVPYSEALDDERTFTPAYDSQQAVYTASLTLINEAIADLKPTVENFTGKPEDLELPAGWDIHSYQGNLPLWLKFAYSLKARLHLHMGEYDEALEAASKGITSVEGVEDLEFIHTGLAGQDRNLWFDFIEENRSGYLDAVNSFARDLMLERLSPKTNDSARVEYFYDFPVGDSTRTYTLASTRDGAFAPDANTPGFTAAETYLIMAEVEARKGNNASAIDHLNNARTYWNNKLNDSSFVLLEEPDFDTGGELEGKTVLSQVYEEAYLSLNSQIEVFTFLRRVGFDAVGLTPTNGASFPQRFFYPQGEVDSNPNTPAQGANDLFVPLPLFQK